MCKIKLLSFLPFYFYAPKTRKSTFSTSELSEAPKKKKRRKIDEQGYKKSSYGFSQKQDQTKKNCRLGDSDVSKRGKLPESLVTVVKHYL